MPEVMESVVKRWYVSIAVLLLLATPAWSGVCEEWNQLYDRIRDFAIDPAVARQEFSTLHQQLKAIYGHPGVGDSARVYPVAGYDSNWGVGGAAFKPKGYTFFNGNPKGIHPSIDLFILDKDQDCLDDRNGQPVSIVAYSGGVVVGVHTEWAYPDERRGGKYVWIYDPLTDHYSYYAHLSRVDVQLGQIVSAGDQLGLLGRTGKNAYKQRSPTHLHLMVLAYRDGALHPYTPWPELVRARLVP